MFYIIGLGNPEQKYDGTRHNVGFAMVDHVREMAGFSDWATDKYAQAKVASGTLADVPVALYLPQTYMNKSGETIAYITEKLGATPEQFIVVYDDVDLPIGELKVSVARGAGGHNGIKSIINQIGKDFIRVRVGVAGKHFITGKTKRPHGSAMSRHVLGTFSFFEKATVKEMKEKTIQAITKIVKDGPQQAMNTYN